MSLRLGLSASWQEDTLECEFLFLFAWILHFWISWDVSEIKLVVWGEYVEDLKPILVTKAILNLKLYNLNCFTGI